MASVVDTDRLATYDTEGVKPYINDFSTVKVTGTVSGDTLSFTNSKISSTAALDGPYIADVLVGITDVAISGTTVTYTLSSEDANGKGAYLWVRSIS